VVEELLPTAVAVLAQVNVDERIVLWLEGLSDKRQAGPLRRSAAFFDITAGAGTNDILPNRFSAHRPGNHMVQRQLAGRILSAAILAPVLVAGKDIAAIELHIAGRQPVIKQQPNDPRHRDIEIYRGYPIVPIRLEMTAESANLAPTRKIIIGILTLLQRDDFRQVTKQQGKGTPGPYDADSHVMLVEHQDITIESGFDFASNHPLYLKLCALYCTVSISHRRQKCNTDYLLRRTDRRRDGNGLSSLA